MGKTKNDKYTGESNFNKYLLNENVSLGELGIYLRLIFESYKDAGNSAGISETRVRQIIIGYNLPKSAKIISRIARGWNINPVKLTLLFERTPQFVTADKYGVKKNG